MSTNLTTSSDWVNYYDQTVVADDLPAAVATTAAPDGGSLTAKGNLSKTIRRRSRASKKTPTTILNTSPTNFRSLVQQFTGCTSSRAGPVNLSFGGGASQQDAAVSINNNNNSTAHGFDQYQELLNYQVQFQSDDVFTAGGGYYAGNNMIAAEENFPTNYQQELRRSASGDRSHGFF